MTGALKRYRWKIKDKFDGTSTFRYFILLNDGYATVEDDTVTIVPLVASW